MAFENFRELFIQQIAELDPTIDTSVGSNFRDLVVTPVSLIFNNISDSLDAIENRLNISNLEELSSEELDAFGKQFLVERSTGAYDLGKIKLFYEQPTAVSLLSGTLLKGIANEVNYNILGQYSTSKFLMSQKFNELEQLYESDEIEISSSSKVENGSLAVGSLLTGTFKPTPVKIVVTTTVTGGEKIESDEEFLERIKNSIKTSSLASENVLKAKIKDSTTVSIVDVIGAGSPFMKRDLVEYDPLVGKTVENFQYVKSGEQLDLKTKGHSAYVNNFVVTSVVLSGSAVDVVWPEAPASWTSEFSNDLYRNIYLVDDGDGATQDQYQILSIQSWNAERLGLMQKSDGINPDNKLVWEDEIRLDGSTAVLGKTPDPQDTRLTARIPIDMLNSLLTDLTVAISKKDLDQVEQIHKVLYDQSQVETFANVSPILHKTIGQHTGIAIDTRMSTTDGTPWGEMAYVTVLRNDKIFMSHDGYGMAWRKQPDFLIRLNYDNYSDAALRAADIATFIELFDVDPVAQNLIGSDILRTGNGNDQYWFYNVYLVDNNVLQEETFVGTSKVFDSINGINQYLQRGKYWIEPEILYDFKIEIQTTLATNIYVKPALSGSFDLVASKGATYPAYVPASGYKITTGNSQINLLDASAGNVGIAVGETKGWEWYVHDFYVRSIVQTFPMHLFKFKIDGDKWSSLSAPFQVDYWGVGYDPTRFALAGYVENSRTQVAIWNPGTNEWDLVGTSLATIADSLEYKKISKDFPTLNDYLDLDGYVHVAASAANFGPGFEDNVDHNLISYYVQLSNPEAGEKHLGNMVDAWCFEPEAIEETAVQATITNGYALIEEPYVCEIVEVREEFSQVVIPQTDYVIYNFAPKETSGPNNKIKLIFSGNADGTGLTVIVRKWLGGAAVSAFFADPENKYPATSLIGKASPLAVVTIDNLEFSGTLSVERAKEVIKDFVNSNLTTSLEKSDLVNILYTAGADYVNLDMKITIKSHDYQMAVSVDVMENRFTLAQSLTKFFTTTDLLSGVTKL